MRGDPAAAGSPAPQQHQQPEQPEAARLAAAGDELVLVLAPTGRDMPLACQLLIDRAGIACEACSDIVDLCHKLRRSGDAPRAAAVGLRTGATPNKPAPPPAAAQNVG